LPLASLSDVQKKLFMVQKQKKNNWWRLHDNNPANNLSVSLDQLIIQWIQCLLHPLILSALAAPGDHGIVID
jgi:hypothetical protein